MRPSEPIAPPHWPVPGFGGLLCGVVLVAAWLRIQFCHAGLPYLHVWDEPQTASTALGMLRSGDFNPHFFHYGSLMIYVSLLVDIVHALSLLGMSPRSPEALTSVGDIVINADTQWHWTISHPSFYFWNRVVVAGMGAGTVALVGWIGRWIAGPVAGLTAAVLLAGASVHILESAVIMNDAPLTFFVLAAALGAIAFLESAKPAGLVLSLVSVGLAMGCKYTGGIGRVVVGQAASRILAGLERATGPP